jgi:hypothetical protein
VASPCPTSTNITDSIPEPDASQGRALARPEAGVLHLQVVRLDLAAEVKELAMKQRLINTILTIAVLALTALLILTALPLAGIAAPRLDRQPLESLPELNCAEATERGAPSVGSTVQAAPAENVELVGQIGGAANAVAVQGNYAYFGVGPALTILDVSNPASPITVGKTMPLPEIVQDVAVVGNYAYIAAYGAGLRIINVTNPAAPTEVGFYDTPGSARGVAVAGNYAYVADLDSGLRIINVSNPAAPSEAGFYDTPGEAYGVAMVGNYAADGDLHIINVTSP